MRNSPESIMLFTGPTSVWRASVSWTNSPVSHALSGRKWNYSQHVPRGGLAGSSCDKVLRWLGARRDLGKIWERQWDEEHRHHHWQPLASAQERDAAVKLVQFREILCQLLIKNTEVQHRLWLIVVEKPWPPLAASKSFSAGAPDGPDLRLVWLEWRVSHHCLERDCWCVFELSGGNFPHRKELGRRRRYSWKSGRQRVRGWARRERGVCAEVQHPLLAKVMLDSLAGCKGFTDEPW